MKAPASATGFLAMSSAAARCCIWSMRPATIPARPIARSAASSPPTDMDLKEKPELVALSRADIADKAKLKKGAARRCGACEQTPLVISAATGQGIEELLDACLAVLGDAARDSPAAAVRAGRT